MIKDHSTENYLALKNNVQALKNTGYVSFGFDKVDGPNVTSNPLPNHYGPKINDILESFIKGRKTCIRDVVTPIGVIYEKLVQARFLQSRRGEIVREEVMNNDYYQYHAKVQGHDIQECIEFRNMVHDLMDKKEIEFSDSIDQSINVIMSTTYSGTLRR